MNLYDSIIEAVEKYELPANERGQLYTAVIEYLYWGREPGFRMSKVPGLCYEAMRPVFDHQRAQSARAKKPRASRRKAKAQPNPSQNVAESEPSASQNVAESYPNANKQEQEQEQEQEPKPCVPASANAESGTLSGKPDDSPPPAAGAQADEPDEFAEMRRQVIAHLNAVTGSHFRPNTKETSVKHLNARFREGYTVEDCKRVVDTKAAEWLGNPKMRTYLRPETLFCSHFEGYLNQPRPREASSYGDWGF